MTASFTLLTTADLSGYDDGQYEQITGIASSNDGKKMYISLYGNSTNGVIKSTDSGITWTSVLGAGGYTSIACSSDGTIIYTANLGIGLYKSTDSGTTWNEIIGSGTTLPGGSGNPEVNAGYDFANVDQVACDATGLKLIMTTNYAAVIYSSIDGGLTWSDVYLIPYYSEYAKAPTILSSNADGSVLYYSYLTSTTVINSIYKSTDNGSTWNVISSLGGAPEPFAGISTNLTGDFVFAIDGNNNIDIFYETHAAKAILVAPGGSTYTAITSYNNGNNAILSGAIGGDYSAGVVQTYSVTNLFPPGPIPGPPGPPTVACFKEDSKILCYKDDNEIYMNIQDIRKGDLIKTCRHGYVPVNMIGTSKLYNSGNNLRGKNRLYICTIDEYSELTEELIITGCHSILLDYITDTQKDKTIEMLGRIMVTDNKYRLMACIDERAKPYEKEGIFNIWHIALDNDDYYMNYGIYANGLLVETCSKRFLKELSGMNLIE